MAIGDIKLTIPGLDLIISQLADLNAKVNTLATQADIDALATRVGTIGDTLSTALADIRSDIATLKTQGVDTSALEANVARLDGAAHDAATLAAENPPT